MKVGEACRSCGCTYLFSAKQLARPAHAFTKCEAGPQSAPWVISFKCPGCGLVGTHFGDEYSQLEAQSLVRAQRRLTESAAAKEWALDWRQEVRRRAETEAGVFTGLLRQRLPQLTQYLQPVPPVVDAGGSDDPDWDCALILSIPPENPAVDASLQALVKCREVRVQWMDHWHHHFEAGLSTAPTDYGHLDRAVTLLEELLAEDLLVVNCYRQGECVSGGMCRRDQEPRPSWVRIDPAHSACGECVVIRSWRGNYDRLIPRPEAVTVADPTGSTA